MFWVYLAIWVASFILSELFAPKPEVENARPSGLGDFNFPTATEGRVVPLLWGTVQLSAPNIIWYGDLRTERIREKIKTGMFSSKKVTVGYKYYVGIQFAFCRGPMTGADDGLMQILVDDESIYDTSPLSAVASGSVTVNEPTLFGQDSGGISGTFTMFPGSSTQVKSTYLEGAVTFSPDILPAYRGTAYLVAEQIYIGNSPSLRPFKFVVRRIPDGLSLGADALINNFDANPMNVLYEILTNTEWGLARSTGDIDTTTLAAVGATLAAEGNGFSALLDNPKKTEQIIQEIERQCDGVLQRDITTGQYTFKLIREADIPSPLSSLLSIDETNCKKVEFSRGSWSETKNIVRVQYADPGKNYATSYGLAQDMANKIIQGAPITVTENFMGVKNAALANYIAWRDLRNLATPLAKATLTVNRELYTIKPGDLFLLSWDLYGITDLLMRATRVNYGELLNNKITIDAVEDVFTTQAASFHDPIDSSWSAPTQTVTAEDPEDQVIFETPRLMQLQDPDNPDKTPRITALPRLTGGAGDEYDLYTHEATSASGAITGTFINNGTNPNFVLVGQLRSALPGPLSGSVATQGAGDYDVDPLPGESLADLIDADALSESEIDDLLSLVYITPPTVNSPDQLRDFGEFILYTQAVESVGGSPLVTGIRLFDCWRGALDSRVQDWPAGSLVWFVSFGGASISSEQFTNNFYVAAKICPSTQESGALGVGSATITNVTRIHDGFRVNAPLCPNEITIGSSRYNKSVPLYATSSYMQVSWTRRNWRTLGAQKSVKGENSDGTTFNPGTTDAGDGLSYIIRMYDISSPNIGSPNFIYEYETPADDPTNYLKNIPPNDLMAMVLQPNGAQLRIEILAKHRLTSPGQESRDACIHEFQLVSDADYAPDKYLGRIPYGTVVSPGIEVFKAGSPGSPQVIPNLTLKFAVGAQFDEGTGSGDQGKLFILSDDGSPAQLVHDYSLSSPDSQYIFNNLQNGSPSNWAGHHVNILHFHRVGRPIFFRIQDTTTGELYAWGVMEPFTSTVPTAE